MRRDKSASRLFLTGYFGEGNFGDEEILKTAVKEFSRRGYALRVLLSEKACRFPPFPALSGVNKASPFALIRAILWADAVVSPGGNLLQNESSFRSLCYYTLLFRTARFFGKKTCFLSSGFGAFSGRKAKRMARGVLEKADLVGVRSIGDFSAVFHLTRRTVSVIYMPDLCAKSDNVCVKREKRTFSVIMGKKDFFPDDEVKVLEKMTGLSAKRILFHESEDLPPGGDRKDFLVPKSAEELFGILSDSAFTLSGRYHGAVFSLLAGVPCFLSEGSEKCRRFLNDYSAFCKPYPEEGLSYDRLCSFLFAYSPYEAQKRVEEDRGLIDGGLMEFDRSMERKSAQKRFLHRFALSSAFAKNKPKADEKGYPTSG